MSVLNKFFVNEAIPYLLFINIFIFSCLTFVSYTFLVKNAEENSEIEEIYWAGGEPLVWPAHWRYMKRIIENTVSYYFTEFLTVED